jgi:hypothetical protein
MVRKLAIATTDDEHRQIKSRSEVGAGELEAALRLLADRRDRLLEIE